MGNPTARSTLSWWLIVRAERRTRNGFTLLEVLIALLVLALALLGLARTGASQVQAFGDLRERTLAGWLAADILAETRLASQFPGTGKSDGQRKFAGRDWRWELIVESTDVATMRRLNVRVHTAQENAPVLVELTGFSGTDLQP
jgi:general secretion pathway protein I